MKYRSQVGIGVSRKRFAFHRRCAFIADRSFVTLALVCAAIKKPVYLWTRAEPKRKLAKLN